MAERRRPGLRRAALAGGRAFLDALGRVASSPAPAPAEVAKAVPQAAQPGFEQLIRPVYNAQGQPVKSVKGRPTSIYVDPYQAGRGLGFRERAYGSAIERTREIIANTPVIGLLIDTLSAEVAAFAQVRQDGHGVGCQVRLRDLKEKATPASDKRARELMAFFQHTGDPDSSALRDSFSSYLRKIARDSWSYAQDATEIIPDRKGLPSAFYAVDASTIRIAQGADPNVSTDLDEEVRYVQVVHGRVVTAYRYAQMLFGIRNPVTDIRMAGYGLSEIESMMRVVAAVSMTWEYQVRAFSTGTNIRGIANIKEEMSYEQFEATRDDFMRFASGVDNAHGTLVMNALQGMDYHDLTRSNQELGYDNYNGFLIKLLCAAFRTSPSLLNLEYGQVGVSSTIGTQSNPLEKLQEGKERAIGPMLGHIFTQLNQRILWPLDEAFELVPTGLEERSAEAQEELDQKAVRSYLTVDELRHRHDLSDLPDGSGKVVLDATWQQARSQAAFAAAPIMAAPQAPSAAPTGAGDQGGAPASAEDDEGLEAKAPGETTEKSLRAAPRRHLWSVDL